MKRACNIASLLVVSLLVSSWPGTSHGKVSYEKAVKKAQWYVRTGKLKKALSVFKKVVAEDPYNLDACFNAGNIAKHLGQCEDVLLYFRCFTYMSDGGSADDKTAARGLKQCAKKKQAATVSFESKPAGAEVLVNGVLVGHTPLRGVVLWPGRYKVMFRHQDCKPAQTELNLDPGQKEVLVRQELELLPAYGELLVETVPKEGVEVYVDEKLVATTPMKKVKVLVGKRLVRLAKPGYDRWVRYVRIEKDKLFVLKATLEKSGEEPVEEEGGGEEGTYE